MNIAILSELCLTTEGVSSVILFGQNSRKQSDSFEQYPCNFCVLFLLFSCFSCFTYSLLDIDTHHGIPHVHLSQVWHFIFVLHFYLCVGAALVMAFTEVRSNLILNV